MSKRNQIAMSAKGRRSALMLSAAAIAVVSLGAGAAAAQVAPDPGTLPVGSGNFTHGSGSVNTVGNDMTVTQTTDRGVIDWDSFDIASDSSVHFAQNNASSVTINRVDAGGGLSDIYGTMTSTGVVVILNPNGIIFGGTANVDVGGLVASTGDIDTTAFMAGGPLSFTGATAGMVDILTGADISISNAGLAAFVAPHVRNSGTITAIGGSVSLAAGETFTLDLAGDGLVELGVPTASPLVENYGSILATGGRIQLSAAAASAVVGNVINTSGVLQVGAAHEADGVIILEASSGDIEIGGDISGGDVTISGDRIHGAGDIDTGGSLEINVNTSQIADTTTEGDSWIQDAVNLVGVVGGEAAINVGAGEYLGFGTSFGGASDLRILGDAGAVIDGSGGTSTGRIVDLRADGTVFSGFTIQSDGNGVGVSVSGRGVTVSGNTIMNVLTGVQTTTQYAAGDSIITGNDIFSVDYGVSLQNTGNTVTNNIVMASVEGVGLLQGANTFNGNTFHIGIGGDALNLYGTASASQLTASDNMVRIHGGGLQGAVDLGGDNGLVVVGDGVYNENILITQDNLTLLSVNGRDSTTIQGVAGAGRLGAVQVSANANDLTLGAEGQGFTIIGFDNASAGLETAAVYFQGANSGSTVAGNRITANGDGGLMTEYGAVVSNLTIDDNIFDGQTFVGLNPAGEGFGQQFTLHNVPRQLVVIGGGNGGGNTSNVTFTNNQVTGVAGGVNGDGQEQGNTLVTIDSQGATITGNTFAGTTTRYGNQLRARGTNTVIAGNFFVNANMGAATSPLYVRNSVFGAGQADFATMIADNAFIGQGAWADSSGTGFHSFSMSIQGAVNEAAEGATVSVLEGTYDETVSIARGLTLAGAGMEDTAITGGMLLSGAINGLNLSGFTISGTGTGHAVIRGASASITDLTMDDVRVDAGSVSGRAGISGGHYGGDISITNSEFVNIDHWVVFDTRSGAGGPGAGTNVNSFVFANNVVDNVQGGITVRQNDGGTGSVTITGNTIQNIGDSTWSSGGIFKIFNAGNVIFSDNDVSNVGTNTSLTSDGVAYGAALLMRGVDNLTVDGNTFTNVHMAVATEKNGFAAPTLTTFTNNTFNNVGYAFFMPSDALAGGSVVFGAGNAINSGGDSIQHIVWRGGSTLDLTGVLFDGELGSEMTEAELFALEDMITHGTDVAGAGLALVNADNVYVTQSSGSIQRGVDAAGTGFTVNIDDGTYNERVVLNTADLTLRSANQYGAIIDAGGTGDAISISSGHGALGTITIDGFTVQNWNSGGIIQRMPAGPLATVHVRNNNVIGPVGGSTAHGNGIQVAGDGSTVTDNTVTGAVLNSTSWSGSGIVVVNGSNITVSGNQISGSDTGIGVMNYNNAGGMTGIVVDGNDVSGAIYDAVSVQVYGGPIGSVQVTGNTLHGNANGVGVWDYGPGGLPTVTITGNDFADNQSHVSGNFAHLTIDSVLGSNTFDQTVHAAGGTTIWGDLSFAVSQADAGSDLLLSADTFVEDDQILIDRDLTLTGQDGTVVAAGRNFTGSAPANAWWLVEEGVTFGLGDLDIDGAGFSITTALRNHGHTTVDGVDFSNIVHGSRNGVAIATFGGVVGGGSGAGTWDSSSLTVRDSTFSNIGRIGVLVKGTGATADIIGNTFIGKGDGDWLDYGIEVGASGTANIIGNLITGNTGVAASDGSTSAGVLVTSYYGGASTAFLEGNVITGNTTGIHVGYNSSDLSSVVARSNDLSGNDAGMALTSTSATADASGNWWGSADEAAILAYMGGDEGGSVDFSTYLTSGADADVADGFQGDFSDVAVTALGGQTGAGDRIQEGVDFAATGGTVNVGAGTFLLNGTVDIDRSVSLIGAGQGATLIDGSAVNGYGMLVEADDVSLSGFTFQGNNSTSSGHYGVKVQPDTGDASDRVHNFSISDVTIQGWGGTELDLNGVVGAMIDGVTADGQGTKGVGIALTDSADVTIVNSTTLNNLWGSVALYQTNRFYDQQLTDIHIDANANSFGEDLGVFAQSYSDIGLEIGDLYLTGFSHIVANPDHRANGDEFLFFRTSEQDALDFAVNLNPAESDSSIVGGWTGSDFDGTFTVGIGNLIGGGTQALSIAAAVGAADDGNTIQVRAGTYAAFGSSFGGASDLNILGDAGATIDGSGVTGRIVDLRADGTTFSGFTITGDGTGVGVSVSGRGVTVADNMISNVLTGVQTTTQYAAGDAVITGNTISSDYGISLQNTGNTVSGNTVNAAVEGVGLLQGANAFSGNTFTIGAGGDALNLYGTASAADMTGGDNTVTIAGGGLQGAVDLALDDGTVNVGDGIYAEDVLVSGVRTLVFGDVVVDGLTLAAGAAGSGVSGDVTSTGDLAFAGDVNLLGDLDLSAAGDLAMAGVTGAGHDLTLSGVSVSLGSATVGGLDITGATTLTGGSYVADQITIAGVTTLTQDTVLNTSGVNGDVSLGSVNGASAGGQDLTVLAGAGDIDLGQLGGSTALGAISLSGGAIQSVGANAIGAVHFNGLTVSLAGDYATGGGDLTVSGPVTLAGDMSADTDGGDAAFGTVNGAWALDIDAGPGTITVAALGGGTALSDVSLSGGAVHTAGATTTGDQSYDGDLTLAGVYATGGGDFSATGAGLLAGATSVVTGGGDLALGSVDGGHALTLNAGGGEAVLGSMGATTRLGAISVTAASTVLEGNVYRGASLSFLGSDADSTVRLTRTSTSFNSQVSDSQAGNITIVPHLIGTTAGAQSVSFIAGSGTGDASANGDISIGDAGSDALRLGSMTVRGDDFSAQTVKLAGNYTANLTGNQTFSANTLDTLGNVNAVVGGNDSGPIIAGGSVNLTVGGTSTGSLQSGGSTTVTTGGGQDRIIDAGGPVNLTSGGGIGGSVTTTGNVNLQSAQNVDVEVNGGSVNVNAPGGQITGNFTEITTDSGGTFVINGETVVGSGDADARQFLTDQFITPAGGVVGSTGQIQLPVGLAIALIAPAGEGAGQRRPIVVNSIERLGELLRLGYTAIIVQIDDGDEEEYEQELDIALEGDLEPVA